MNLEQFARAAIAKGATGFAFSDLALDKNTNKVTAILQDGAGTTVHARIEGSTLVFQSWDDSGAGAPEAPHVSEAKQKAAEDAAADEQKG